MTGSTRGQRAWWLAAVAVVLVFHVLLAYGLPWWVVAGATLLFALLVPLFGAKNAVTLAVTLAVLTLAAGVAVRLTGLDRAIYYRPHEQFAVYDHEHEFRRYQRNVDAVMEDVHGDLQSMVPGPIAVARDVVFRTDSRGFRNSSELDGKRWLLVGDSFVAGVGVTQDDILAEQLRRRFGLECYGLASPGAILDYELFIESVGPRPQAPPDVLLFVFEGNDFPESLVIPADRDHWYRNLARSYFHIFQTTGIYRLSRSVRYRIQNRDEIRNRSLVETMETPAGTMVFYRPYMEVTRRLSVPRLPEFEAALGRLHYRVAAVFFIPTKYRVYDTALRLAASRTHPGGSSGRLPHAQWDRLREMCGQVGLPCVDLTGALVERSVELLGERRFTYWPDDTHWNASGIAVAAQAVHAVVSDAGD